MYDVAMDMARQERGLVAFARHNNVEFEIDGKVLGLGFHSVGLGLRHDAAMLDQATRQLQEAVHEQIS